MGAFSNFAGRLFNANDMKENSGVAAAVGSFFNGVIGHGVLGTVDGIASVVTNPYGMIEVPIQDIVLIKKGLSS